MPLGSASRNSSAMPPSLTLVLEALNSLLAWKMPTCIFSGWRKYRRRSRTMKFNAALKQRDAFKAQIELALEHNLALVIHSRDAYDETLRILEEYKNNITHAVMHCLSYDQAYADTVTAWNFFLGIGGTVTYPKNNDLRSIVQNINLKHIVLETDAPFLPPQTMRGKQNHPQFITIIAEYIAQLRGESFDAIANQTTDNALQLFGLDKNKR